MTLDDWFTFATNDADCRALHDLRPVLKGLQNAAASLRAAEWNDDARGPMMVAAPVADAASPEPHEQPHQHQQHQQHHQQPPQPSPRASS